MPSLRISHAYALRANKPVTLTTSFTSFSLASYHEQKLIESLRESQICLVRVSRLLRSQARFYKGLKQCQVGIQGARAYKEPKVFTHTSRDVLARCYELSQALDYHSDRQSSAHIHITSRSKHMYMLSLGSLHETSHKPEIAPEIGLSDF